MKFLCVCVNFTEFYVDLRTKFLEKTTMSLTKKNNFDKLVDNVYQMHSTLQQNAVKAVNYNLTIRNWLIGCYIVEFEQNGEDRAKYGAGLLVEMAKKVREKGIKGLDAQSLRGCRTFYNAYPQIRGTVSRELQRFGFKEIMPHSLRELPIRGSVTSELESTEIPIRRSATAKFQQAEIEKIISFPLSKIAIGQVPSTQFSEEYPIPPEMLLSRLNFSHFLEIMRRDDPLERLFYEVEAIKNNWSVRELERAIDTAFFVRSGLSKNKEAIIAKIKNLTPTQTAEVVRDPYFLEFLGLEEKAEYSETELEELILNHLQQFLMELGTGFCFEARQKRITFDNTHYKIDLVFYHRILKSHVLIDLKIGKFTHADAGQMTVYLNYYKDNEMAKGDNPPIGIILCGDKNETLVKYATSADNQMFVSQYLVKLPEKQVLENFMRRELNR